MCEVWEMAGVMIGYCQTGERRPERREGEKRKSSQKTILLAQEHR